MSRGLINTFIFLAGGAVGAGIAVYLTKETYRQLAEERADAEIESVKETWQRKYEQGEIHKESEPAEDMEEVLESLPKPNALKVKKRDGYTRYGDASKPESTDDEYEEEAHGGDERPYVIPPDQFGEIDNYSQIELTMFSDGVVVDTNTGRAIEDVDDTIGSESLNTFGVYEEDSVYVRNDLAGCDYEILADERTYQEFIDTQPRSRGGR